MNDLGRLADGDWQWNGWLTPKGRVISLFALLRVDAETLWLLVDDADPAPLVENLRRFVFRSKVAIVLEAQLRVGGAFAAPGAASASRFAQFGDDAVGDDARELDLGDGISARTLRIGRDGEYPLHAGNAERWRAFDLVHGLPHLPPDQRERWTPQQLSLQRLNAYSVRKGCYPGQEIVARTHFLGKAKRGLARLQIEGDAQAGDDVIANDAALGSIVCASAGGAGLTEALAVLPAELGQAVTVNGLPADFSPLLEGLER